MNKDFTSIVTRIASSGRFKIFSILLIKSVVSLISYFMPLTIGCKWISMKWDIFVECELMERTIGLPGLIALCILGRKYTCVVLGFAFIRFFHSCSLISFSFMKDSMALLMICASFR